MNDYYINIQQVNSKSIKDNDFWSLLAVKNKPFFCLAPMADVTDPAFRRIVAKYGQPDVIWTEMVSVEGLLHPVGYKKLIYDLQFSDRERPIIAQVFGSDPDKFYEVAKLIKKLGFDGLDINMGCPDRNVNRQGAGSALIKDPTTAKRIINEAKRGAGDMPISVKTRIGFNKNEIEKWLPVLLSARPAAITIHGRTRKEMSKVPAHWNAIGGAVKIAEGSGVVIIGNGDIKIVKEGMVRAEETGVDGIMIGRGVFGNPWVFNKKIQKEDLSQEEILKVMLEHVLLYEKIMIKDRPEFSKKSFLPMRKHMCSYVSGFSSAKILRKRLMEAKNGKEVKRVIFDYLK